MKLDVFEDAIKWSTVYFMDKTKNQLIIRDGSGNIDYRKFNEDGFVNWTETHSGLQAIKEMYDSDELLCNEVNDGILTMSYDCPYEVEQDSPYREFICRQ